VKTVNKTKAKQGSCKMDPSLLKGLNAFKKKSLAQPVIEKKPVASSTPAPLAPPKPKRKRRRPELPAQLLQQSKKQAAQQTFNYKTHGQIRTKSRFSVLSSIVDLLKSRYQNKVFDSVSLDDLLDLTKNTDIKPSDKEWLNDAMKQNIKISFLDNKYAFKPKYTLRDKKSLVRLLEKHEQNGLGGVLLDDVQEGLPNACDIVKAVSDRCIFVTRSNDKKAILFHYDASYAVNVDEEFQKHWRGIAVEGLAEPDIERYLNSSGITTMQGISSQNQKRPDKRRGQRKKLKLLNTHLVGNVLKDYSEPVGGSGQGKGK